MLRAAAVLFLSPGVLGGVPQGVRCALLEVVAQPGEVTGASSALRSVRLCRGRAGL